MTRWTDQAWWTVDDAARLLRMDRKTLYAAIAADDFPHTRVGSYIRIPAEALMLTPRVSTYTRNWHQDALRDAEQLFFDFDPPIIPVRLYRNGDVRKMGDYEVSLSKKKWRNPDR